VWAARFRRREADVTNDAVGGTALPSSDNVEFFLLVASREDARCARLLIGSLRAFGGGLGGAPVWTFVPRSSRAADDAPRIEGAEVVPLEVDAPLAGYPFGAKVAACARAEEVAEDRCGSLVWMSPQCLIVNPPDLLRLPRGVGAALRPVHIRNVGVPAGGPLDVYWRAVYDAVGLDGAAWSVESLVDPEAIGPYYNTHLFSVDPSSGLLREWCSHFRAMIADEAFQGGPCADGLHRIFLHQAILSALAAKTLGRDRIRELPLEYSYPLHFHSRVPPAVRPRTLNELVCPVYEGAYSHPGTLGGITTDEPLLRWLEERARR
jgi:hypothetical protein